MRVQLGLSCVPVERQVITWCNLDRVVCLHISHDIASQIDGIQILHGRVVVAAFATLTIVCWDANTLERALVNTVDEDTLTRLAPANK